MHCEAYYAWMVRRSVLILAALRILLHPVETDSGQGTGNSSLAVYVQGIGQLARRDHTRAELAEGTESVAEEHAVIGVRFMAIWGFPRAPASLC